MIETIVIFWFAFAILVAWGFHLIRRHWIRVGEKQRQRMYNQVHPVLRRAPSWERRPSWENPVTQYDWDDSGE